MIQKYRDYSSFFSVPDGMVLYAGISLAAAGTMNPFEPAGLENRAAFFRERGFSEAAVSFCRQIHSRRVYNADDEKITGAEGDGMITSHSGHFLSVTAADCMPVFLFDSEHRAIGLCHSGWKGTGIGGDALRMMGEVYGTRAENVTALLGPAIGTCCYKVDKGRADEFAAAWGPEAVRTEKMGTEVENSCENRYYLDLKRANISFLEQVGVKNIKTPGECTRCHPEYASFRREGPENYTRMVAYFGFLQGPPLKKSSKNP